MREQIDLFRTDGLGDLRQLAIDMSTQVAMLRYLDNNRNKAGPVNLIYRMTHFTRLPPVVLLPLLSVLIAFALTHFMRYPVVAVLALMASALGLLLVTTERRLRPRGARYHPARARVAAAAPSSEITGWLAPDEVKQRLQSARYLAFPSLWYECQPLATIEALLRGVPQAVDHLRDQVSQRNQPQVDRERLRLHQRDV